MNILYYIPTISQDMGGIRQYAVTLLKIISKDTGNRYFVYHEVDDAEVTSVLDNNPHLKQVKTNGACKKGWQLHLYEFRRAALNYCSKLLGKNVEMAFVDEICKKHKIDIIHCPYQYLPESKIAKSVCTMHDVQELHFPEYFTPEDRALRAVSYLRYIKNADRIIVSYQHIKDDILKYFQTSPDKVAVCLLEMDNLWFDKYTPDDITSLTGLGILNDFIFYPANTWQHKNHIRLLEALVILKEDGLNIKLVCTGHKTPYFETHLKPFIKQHDLHNQVIFPGVVDEKTLYSLYKKCTGVAVPTLYEAGSFPLMESILLDVPVICSNVTSLPETVGDKNFLFDPVDAIGLSEKLKVLWTDETFRQKGLANCKKQAKYLRNTDALNTIKAIYNSCEILN